MPLYFLVDENLRGTFWQLIQRHNARGLDLINAVRVGDVTDLPLSSDDDSILDWCERNTRILITADRKTMPGHVADHFRQGKHLPGVFILRRDDRLAEVLQFVALAAHASDPGDWADWITYLP